MSVLRDSSHQWADPAEGLVVLEEWEDLMVLAAWGVPAVPVIAT